jgi:hypothetical protein
MLRRIGLLTIIISSILVLPVLSSTFIIGNEHIEIYGASEGGNTTGNAGTAEITIRDTNGTELFRGNLEGKFIPCWLVNGCVKGGDWGPGPSIMGALHMNVTMKDQNGTELISFENVTVNCQPPIGPSEFPQCVER